MKLFFSVGEPSGDEHAAALIRELRARNSAVEACGYGGPEMQAAGCDLHYRLTDLAVMGFVRVLPLIFKFLSLVRKAKQVFKENPPDAVVLVDFAGFNWHIAKHAKKAGIPVYFYMPPQLWAWAPWRLRKLKRTVDHVISGLPFERDWYEARGVSVKYVGHPFFDEALSHELDENFGRNWDEDATVIGILPGSRTQEVHQNFPHQVDAVRAMATKRKHAVFPVACYREAHLEWCKEYLRDNDATDLPIELHLSKTSEIIERSKFCLIVSGSVALELLVRKTPAVVVYACTRALYPVGKLLVRLDYYTLPNLMAGEAVYPEYILCGPRPKALKDVIGIMLGWLADETMLEQSKARVSTLAEQYATGGASVRVAEYLLESVPGSTAESGSEQAQPQAA